MEPRNRVLACRRDAIHRCVAALVGVTLIAGAGGCRYRSLAEERLAHRRVSVETIARKAAQREAENPQRLSQAAAYIGDDLRKNGQALDRSLRGVGEYLERDLRRWWERQPAYYRGAGRLLRGKPETIEHTSVILFL